MKEVWKGTVGAGRKTGKQDVRRTLKYFELHLAPIAYPQTLSLLLDVSSIFAYVDSVSRDWAQEPGSICT